MSDPEKPLPESLQKLLKSSPTRTPPEQFYQSVLRKIRTDDASASERKPWLTSLLFGVPVRLAAGTLVLMISFWAIKDQTPWGPKKAELAYEQFNSVNRTPALAGQLKEKSADMPGAKAVKQAPAAPVQYSMRAAKVQMPVSSVLKMDAVDKSPVLAAVPLNEERKRNAPMPSASPAVSDSAEGAIGGSLMNAGEKDQGMPTQWTGTASGIADRREVVVRNEKQWIALWTAHGSNQIPAPAVPTIDFKRDMVIGVWTGTKPSTGYRVDILEIRNEGSHLRVIYREIAPPVGSMTGMALTQPFILRVVPRTDSPVRFEIRAD